MPSQRLLPTPLALAAALLAATPAAGEEPLRIVVLAGYGTPTAFVLWGRVLEDRGEVRPDRERGRLRNAVDTLRALETDEVEGARVVVTVAGRDYAARTDDDGTWRVEASGLAPPLAVGRLPVRVRLAGGSRGEAPPAPGVLHVLDDGPGVAVISDFDDTLVESGVTSKGRLLYRTLTRNAAQLDPVPGAVDAFRRSERAGARAFFYLSGSPQNLHERISAFLELQGLPAGPILLKNVGADPLLDQRRYKTERVEGLLAAFPRWRFVLVGDSGEQDPETYDGIRAAHPDRIRGIVIRRVVGGDAGEGRLRGMTVIDDFTGRPDVIAALVRGG